MELKYTYKQSGKFFIGRLYEYPDYPTQAFSLEELEENLRDIYGMVQRGELDGETRQGTLEVAV